MDLKSLLYFVTVAEELNISRAAEKLSMSQPPLSTQIKGLEKELHTILFIRGKRQLTITPSGKLLYTRAKELLALADKTSQEILTMGEGTTGTIHIGLVEGSAPNLIADWIGEFLDKYPKVSFDIFDGTTEEITQKLRGGLINLGVVSLPCDTALMNTFSLGKERVAVFINSEHPLAKKPGDTVEISDLVGQRLVIPGKAEIRDSVHKFFEDIGEVPHIVAHMDNYLDMAAMASRNVAICLFPATDFVINPTVTVKLLTNPEHYMEYAFAWRKGSILPPAEAAFLEFIQEKLEIH